MSNPHTIPITAVDASGQTVVRCHDCPHATEDEAGIASPSGPVPAPTLEGPLEQLTALVQALVADLGGLDGQLDGRLVRSLRLAPGEVELTLGTDLRGRGAWLAETAFQTLRRRLPDTDIFVIPAAAQTETRPLAAARATGAPTP